MNIYKILAVILVGFSLILVSVKLIELSHQKLTNSKNICLAITPEYILSCNVGNQTIEVISKPQNLEIALKKNNCSVKGRNDIIDIIYCYQNVSNHTKKYKLFVEELSEDE